MNTKNVSISIAAFVLTLFLVTCALVLSAASHSSDCLPVRAFDAQGVEQPILGHWC